MGRWQRYWFADGGRHALAIVRIAVAWSVLMSLSRLATHPQLVAPAGVYRPVGIWMLFGHSPPPAFVIDALWLFAWLGTLCMLFGLFTRITTAVSFVASVSLAAISFSGSAHWSHIYNVVFLAQLALLGARAGDAFSFDALIRHARGLPRVDLARAYQWSLRLVQLAVALMFVGACFHKLAHSHFTLRWVFSDSLRHHLLVKYDLAGLDRPWLVDWLLQDVWRYRTAALLNMLSQLAPLFAVIFAKRPFVRLACGVVFVTEVIGLGLVVDLWNPHWFPLAAVFVDWDRAIFWTAKRLGRPMNPPATLVDWRPPRAPQIFIIAFVIYDIVTAFIPTVDQRLNTYPFSGFPMFATVRAEKPYSEHLPYRLVGDHFEITADIPIEPYLQSYFDHTFRSTYTIRDQAKLKAQLELMRDRGRARYPDAGIRGLRHYVTIFEVPAYPAPARFDRHPIAITGELRPDDSFRSVLGKWSGLKIELFAQNVDTANARLVYYANDEPTPHDLAATRVGDTFTLAAPLDIDHGMIVAVIDDTAWLVASARRR